MPFMQRRDSCLALPHVLYWCGDSEIVVVKALRNRFAVSHAKTLFSSSVCHVMFVRILRASGPLMSFSRGTFAKTGTANGNLNLALLRLESEGRLSFGHYKWQWSLSYPWWKFGR